MSVLKHLILFFISLASLSQAANLVRLAAAPPLMIGFWRLLGAGLLMLTLRAWNSRKSETFFEPVPGRGKRHTYRITHMTDEMITLDGNHPLAGQDLVFEIEATDVRDATPEEISQSEAPAQREMFH